MHPTLLRLPLGRGFDAATVFSELYGDRDDVFWLDSGASGWSYLGAGAPVGVDDFTVWQTLRAVPRGLDADEGAPAFRLGAVGWLGYELRGTTTGVPVSRRSRYPDAAFLRVDRAIAIDGATGEAELLAVSGDADDTLGEWRNQVEALRGAARARVPFAPAPAIARWHDSDIRYLTNIAACQRAIRDGEAYQLCLTNEAEVAGTFDPLSVYLALRESSATHHGGLIRIGGVSLLSASPERFLDIDPAGVVTTRPIKGTRPRGRDAAADAALAAELRASEKERAENLMIVDLMRNDLARVCELGTVAVTGLLEVESYPHVHQLVSTVRGRLAVGRSPIDAIEACFPAGSMTGAPKIRATELLDELEGRARGLYAGALGYVGLDGRVDLAMSIRSIVIDARGATVGAGGGITAMSVPAEELAEAKLKAAALLAALGVTAEGTAAPGRRLGTVDA